MVSHDEQVSPVRTFLKPRQDFYKWLRTSPLDIVYSFNNGRREKDHFLHDTVSEADPPFLLHKPSAQNEKVVLRRSVFILVLAILYIEILFDGLYILLRISGMYISFPQVFQAQLTPMIYFILFFIINVIKLFFILLVCLKWVTTTYEIKEREIKFKTGLIASNQKTFLCKHTQEVICRQGFIGKIFNFGSIDIYDPTLIDKISIDSVQNPKKYAEIIKNNVSVTDYSELIPVVPMTRNL